MALKAAKEQVTAILKSIAEPADEICLNLDSAMGACATKPVGPKVWCIINVEDLPLACVVLKGPCYVADPNRICVVGVASAGPVSELPVLRAMEHGEILVIATELPATGVAKGKAMAALICAAGYAMPSVTLLATPAAVLADKDWDEIHYDPRFAFTPSAMKTGAIPDLQARVTQLEKKVKNMSEAREGPNGILRDGAGRKIRLT